MGIGWHRCFGTDLLGVPTKVLPTTHEDNVEALLVAEKLRECKLVACSGGREKQLAYDEQWHVYGNSRWLLCRVEREDETSGAAACKYGDQHRGTSTAYGRRWQRPCGYGYAIIHTYSLWCSVQLCNCVAWTKGVESGCVGCAVRMYVWVSSWLVAWASCECPVSACWCICPQCGFTLSRFGHYNAAAPP